MQRSLRSGTVRLPKGVQRELFIRTAGGLHEDWSLTRLAVVMITGAMLAAPSLGPRLQQAPPWQGKGLSVVALQPDVAQAMRAQGKKIDYPFPEHREQG